MNFTERYPKVVYDMERNVYYYPGKKNTKKVISKKLISRINSLKIPKVYSTLWVNDEINPNGLLAIALDSKNRKQYYYSNDHVMRREEVKLKRTYEFICNLSGLRRMVARDMIPSSSGMLSKQYVISNMVYILEKTYLRIGNKRYLDQNNSYGLTTLKPEFVSLKRPDQVTFNFHGKHQVIQVRNIHNSKIYDFIKRMKSKRETYLFVDSNGIRITSGDINEYLNKFTCKDFRTYGANTLFVDELKSHSSKFPDKKPEILIRKSIERVSEQMGNSVGVLKKSYLFPCISETFKEIPLKQFKNLSLKNIIKRFINNQTKQEK